MELVGVEKAKVENQQRAMRKRERAEGMEWESRYFERAAGDRVVEMLGAKIRHRSEVEKTGGMWRLNERGEVLLSSTSGDA